MQKFLEEGSFFCAEGVGADTARCLAGHGQKGGYLDSRFFGRINYIFSKAGKKGRDERGQGAGDGKKWVQQGIGNGYGIHP